MMVPRAYHYASSATIPSASPARQGKKSSAQHAKQKKSSKQCGPVDTSPRPRILHSVSAATPSKPVIIPTRTQSTKQRRPSSSAERPVERTADSHDANAIPPSMAALLAITSFQHPRGLSIRQQGKRRRAEIENLSADDFRHSLSSSSPKSWGVLQSGPDDIDSEVERSTETETDNWSITSEGNMPPLSSFRSFSSDSMPSLEMDLDGESANSLSPPTPAQRNRQRTRREKVHSPGIPLSNDGEHPLATSMFPESLAEIPLELYNLDVSEKEALFLTATPDDSISTFKSNLTASLRLLKSAARSLSAPSRFPDPSTLSRPLIITPPSDAPRSALTVNIFEPRFSDSVGINLRLPANIDALPLYLSAQLPAPPPTASIQLQPYYMSPLSTSSATAPPIFLPAANPSIHVPEAMPKAREPRENSSFLRVVVLEMNMRRAGKLGGEGRARIWLGARRDGKLSASGQVAEGIADGGHASGAVVLDGEVGEALEIECDEGEISSGQTERSKGRSNAMDGSRNRRSKKNVPSRWVASLP